MTSTIIEWLWLKVNTYPAVTKNKWAKNKLQNCNFLRSCGPDEKSTAQMDRQQGPGNSYTSPQYLITITIHTKGQITVQTKYVKQCY